MLINITIDADSDSPDDLNALAALIASLGGRANLGFGGKPLDDIHRIGMPAAAQELADSLATDRSDADDSTVAASLNATDKPADASSTDSTGLPWDERIHSNPPTTTQDGKWRKRRGVDEALVASVTAELRGAGQRDDTPPPPSATVEPVTQDVPPPPADTAPGTSAASSAADPTPTPPAGGASRYANFGAFVQAMNGKPGAVYQKLNDHASTLGVADFKSLKDRPDMWDMFFDSFEG